VWGQNGFIHLDFPDKTVDVSVNEFSTATFSHHKEVAERASLFTKWYMKVQTDALPIGTIIRPNLTHIKIFSDFRIDFVRGVGTGEMTNPALCVAFLNLVSE
jgi:hypothetical protein